MSTNPGTDIDRVAARQMSEDVRQMLVHESTVLNHRITWLTAFEGFLFAGFGALVSKELPRETAVPMMKAICYAGLGVAVISLLGLLGSAIATDRLLNWWNVHKPDAYDGPGIIGWALPSQRWAPYLTVWNFLPVVVGGTAP
ncbi:hypothetical protein [Paraburkholderia humisilvae]|uniref:Uncharacterized protein n=1 Tax=Paraburkholderia humisilvae TaxID=627669 RepID=A0A6J5EJE9_9BURK|nr:hypothetical protein [Paraburkholderia humisilvae]CAB3765396.1 hypothetical protein LMG29542_05122 [Paraburkholderia humisilvae]